MSKRRHIKVEKNILNFTLRIDEEMMEKLREIAEEHTRSVNSEILDLIKKAIKEYEQEKKTEN